MRLIDYWGKNIKLIAKSGSIIIGHVGAYTGKEDDPDGKESIIIYDGINYIEAFPDDIQSIEVINK